MVESKTSTVSTPISVLSDSQTFDDKPEKVYTYLQERVVVPEIQNEEEKYTQDRITFAFTCLGLILSLVIMSLNTTLVAPAMTTIAAELNGISSQSWIATAYFVGLNSFQPLTGKFSNIFGSKPVYLVSIIIFSIGTLIAALSTSMNMLIAGRAIQGFGAGGIWALAFITVPAIAPVRLRPRLQSSLGAVYGFTSTVGPLIGSFFVEKVHWHWDFWLNLIIAIVTFIILLCFLRRPQNTKESTMMDKIKRIDYFGSLLSTSFVCCLLLGLNWGQNYGWNDYHAIVPFVGAGVSLILLIVTEGWISKEPNLPAHILLNRDVVVAYMYVFSVGLGFFGTLYFTPIYFQAVFGNSIIGSGIHLIPYMASLIIANVSCSFLLLKFPRVKYYVIFSATCNLIGFSLFYTVNENSSWAHQSGFFIICGVGFGLSQLNSILTVQSVVDVKDIPIATSCCNFFLLFSSSIGVGIYQAMYGVFLKAQFNHLTPDVFEKAQKIGALNNHLYIRHLPLDIQAPVIHAYNLAFHRLFLIPIVLSAISFILSLFYKNIRYGAPPVAKRKVDEEA